MISSETEGDSVDKIDLYNFEDPKFENSRYVLTSPRSLEACSRLSVKPVELLYKPLTEFQEELLPQDVPLRTIYNIYDEQEQIRLRKLHLCREERGRINKDDVQDVAKQRPSKTSTKPQGKAVTKASLQRQRTAWSAGAGHKRVTKDELNKRARELQDESVKLRQELLSRKEGRPKKPASGRRPRSALSSSRTGTPSAKPARSKSVSDIYGKLPPRDRKILDIMRSKREEEQQRLADSERTRLLWEDERKRQETLRMVMENKRRKLLAKESQVKHSHRERNLALLLRDEEGMKSRVEELTKSTVAQAQQRKDMGIFHDSLRKSMSSHQQRLAFEQRRRELEKDARKQEQGAQCTMELRHSQAEENLVNILETRNQQLVAAHEEEEKRLSKARGTQHKLELEMNAWRRKLLRHQRQVDSRAQMAVQVNNESRAQRARQERVTHQQEQRKNLLKLNKEHEQWKRSLRQSLTEKDRKVGEIQQQRENFISQTRSVAQLSQMLRDQVRLKYEHDTFDRKVLDAQIFAKLENRPAARRLARSS
ncbi:hypothetical protein ACOMHN_026919 [Nucella lapillus]